MFRALCLLCVLSLGVACTPSSGPTELRGFFPVKAGDCLAELQGDVQLAAGSLDVNSGRARFLAGIGITGLNGFSAQPIIRSDGRVLDTEPRDAPFMDQLALSYKATPSIGSIKAEVLPISGSGTGREELMLTYNVLTQAAADAIAGIAASDNPADVVNLQVTVEVRGRLQRSGTRISTGQAVLPIRLQRRLSGECPRGGAGPNGYKFTLAECGTSGQFSAPTCCDPMTDAECLARP